MFNTEPFQKYDNHNTPVMAIDNNDYLHILGGSHYTPTKYVKSKTAVSGSTNSVAFTTPITPNNKNRTYSELLIDADNKLHSAFRSGSSYYRLFYENKSTSGSSWSTNPILFADMAHTGSAYRVFRQRLHKDRQTGSNKGLFMSILLHFSTTIL